MKFLSAILILNFLHSAAALAQDNADFLELLDEKDLQLLESEESKAKDFEISQREELDDLEEIKEDVGDVLFEEDKLKKVEEDPSDILSEIEFETEEQKITEKREESKQKLINQIKKDSQKVVNEVGNNVKISEFDVGDEERELLGLAERLQNKIPDAEWKEIAKTSFTDTYKIQDGDTLWRVSKRLFGTGFYYSKVWALNPYITNPHQIEPGMVLAFNSGAEGQSPEIRMGDFSLGDKQVETDASSSGPVSWKNLGEFAEDSVPGWLAERERLKEDGVFVQNASDYTYDDLKSLGALSLVKEYENYDPPKNKIRVAVPDTFDELGFDKSSIVRDKIKSGFYLNTFITSNIAQDFGEIEAGQQVQELFTNEDIVYVRFDAGLSISAGDRFSIYSAEGEVEHEVSERAGYRYTIKGHLQILEPRNDLWSARVFNTSGTIRRKDRITVFTPPIDNILQTFNQRSVEAAIIDGHEKGKVFYSFGDVLYLDRGRADGVELGNVFEVYSFTDRGTGKRITPDPTYKVGELTAITVTENFTTALVTNSIFDIREGMITLTKTLEQAIRENKIKTGQTLADVSLVEQKALEELDVELNLDDVTPDLLEKADKFELSEDELDELERQEREKSIIKDHERDLKELDRLEKEIETSQGLLNEIIEDKDKLLEQEDLDRLEKTLERPNPDAFESLDEIEDEIGKKYLDEDLNAKENPYGLTEFDLEEIDELLNTRKNSEEPADEALE